MSHRLTQAFILILALLSGLNWASSAFKLLNDTQFHPASLPFSNKYVWWMVKWDTNSIVCSITVFHGGFPTVPETVKSCGLTVTQQWQNTPACEITKVCQGYYLHLASTSSVPASSIPENPLPDKNLITSNQTTPNPVDACANIWQAQPPSERPVWLTTPERSEDLATYQDLYYLAGQLIRHHVVDASACTSGGVKSSLYADECGMNAARPVVQFWQNQFDPQIQEAAQVAGIPSTLLKRLFMQESQLWPGTDRYPTHFGLGQATELGLDVLFLFDKEFYKTFCPLMLSTESCQVNYFRQSPENKAILRGALSYHINADCPSCPTGVDLEITRDSIPIFADLVVANCQQVKQIVINATGYLPGAVSNYEDLWRFTLANYHAGSGCVSYALFKAWDRTHTLDGEEVASRFTEPCASVIPYVQNITQEP
jgi:hypothetical protein